MVEFQLLVDGNPLMVKSELTCRHLLKLCKEKLELYREYSDGRYHGGVEHTHLIKMIDNHLGPTIIGVDPAKEGSDHAVEGVFHKGQLISMREII